MQRLVNLDPISNGEEVYMSVLSTLIKIYEDEKADDEDALEPNR